MSIIKGALYIVATPIGNLSDITYRAVEVLRGVDLIAAEDTRHSKVLLGHYGISTPCIAYHEHSERHGTPKLIERLRGGQALALISDAGTPLISDPGFHLVTAAHANAVPIIPIPGASALVAALSASGQPTDRFVFEGYLPARSAARQRRLADMAHEPRTMVFYEAPHRILAAVRDMASAFGQHRAATYAREMTKTFETIFRDTLGGLAARIQGDADQQRGEYVVIVQGRFDTERPAAADVEHMLEVLMRHLPVKAAVAIATELTGEKKNVLYRRAVQLAPRE
jgi:16S rRNA (cytidine1402-2'-O)-methyltransferase